MAISRAVLGAALTAALLAGCSGSSTSLPQAGAQLAPLNSLSDLSPLSSLPACKGQKTTKDYAKGSAVKLSSKGGLLCVPRFKSWSGTMSYPSQSASGYTATLTTSTTAYSGAYWPPTEPGTAIFYIQFQANDSVDFGTKLPKGGVLASTQLKVNKAYSITAAAGGASLWIGMGDCYVRARAGKYGPYLTGVGDVFDGRDMFGFSYAVIEVIPGKFYSTKC